MITSDPVVHDDLEQFTGLIPDLELTTDRLAELRSLQDTWFANSGIELSTTVERADHAVNADVVVRVHRPVTLTTPAACLYSIHGGGYVLGSYAMDDVPLDRYCNEFGCVGVSVEYRLAPETPYPGPLEDCYAGLAWTFAHAGELGIDTDANRDQRRQRGRRARGRARAAHPRPRRVPRSRSSCSSAR